MTDPGTADRTYIGPMTPELVEEIIANERPDAVLPTMGGKFLVFSRPFLGAFLLPSFSASYFCFSLPFFSLAAAIFFLSLKKTKQKNKKQAKRGSTSPRRSPSPASSTSEPFYFLFTFF